MPSRLIRLQVLVLLALLAVVLVGGACGSGTSRSEAAPVGAGGDRLWVVTTVAPLTSIAATVAGDRAMVTGVVPEGLNSHTFEPAPSVAEVLSRADVVFVNGLGLEEPTTELARANLAPGAEIVALGDAVLSPSEWIFDFSFPKEGGKPNPHLWTDPTYALRYAEVIKDELSERDPAGAGAYRRNYQAFAEQVGGFDATLRAAIATVPDDHRKLLTYHDAYAYFARTYGFEVIGAIQVERFDDPTPREMVALIDQVRDLGVPAIFGSEVFPSPVLEQIGREAEVRYVDVLRDDDLPGEPGDAGHSWLGLMRFDYATIVEAMGGDASALWSFPVGPDVPDTATYPQ